LRTHCIIDYYWLSACARPDFQTSSVFCLDVGFPTCSDSNYILGSRHAATTFSFCLTVFIQCGNGGGGHWLVRMEWRPSGWSVCLPLLIFPCTIKSRSSLLAPSHPGGPGKRAVKWLWWCLLSQSFSRLTGPCPSKQTFGDNMERVLQAGSCSCHSTNCVTAVKAQQKTRKGGKKFLTD